MPRSRPAIPAAFSPAGQSALRAQGRAARRRRRPARGLSCTAPVLLGSEGGLPPGSRGFFREAGRKILDQALRECPLRIAPPRICGFLKSGAPRQGAFLRPAARPLDPGSPERAAYGRGPRAGRIHGEAGGPCRRPSSRSHAPADKAAGHCEFRCQPAPSSPPPLLDRAPEKSRGKSVRPRDP